MILRVLFAVLLVVVGFEAGHVRAADLPPSCGVSRRLSSSVSRADLVQAVVHCILGSAVMFPYKRDLHLQ